jgi:hypothetical protein
VTAKRASLFDDVPAGVQDGHVGAKRMRYGVRQRAPIVRATPGARELLATELPKTGHLVFPLPTAGPEQCNDGSHDEPGEHDGRPKPQKQSPL